MDCRSGRVPRKTVILNPSVYRWGHRSSKRASGFPGVIQLGRIKCRPELKVFNVLSLSMSVYPSPSCFTPKLPPSHLPFPRAERCPFNELRGSFCP